jgi:hypothetical protein
MGRDKILSCGREVKAQVPAGADRIRQKKGVISMRRRVLQSIGIVMVVLGMVGCNTFSGAKAKNRTIKLLDLPEPTRAAVDRLMAGGQVTKIEVVKKDGATIYDVEGTLNGKDVEYEITHNGKILSSAESVPYESLPAAVRMAATLYFGSAEQFAASREIEGDKTFYEVRGKKEGKPVTIKLSDDGKVVAEEKE